MKLSLRVVLLLIFCAACGDMNQLRGRDKAQALVAAYSRSIGAGNRGLDSTGDVSFGDVGFSYDAAHDALIGRIFINGALLINAPPKELDNYRRIVGALNDPAIGGMFERAGGVFVLDERKEAYFLVRSYPLATTDIAGLTRAVRDGREVAAIWTTRWLYRVAMIFHGHQPAPTRPVTRKNPQAK